LSFFNLCHKDSDFSSRETSSAQYKYNNRKVIDKPILLIIFIFGIFVAIFLCNNLEKRDVQFVF